MNFTTKIIQATQPEPPTPQKLLIKQAELNARSMSQQLTDNRTTRIKPITYEEAQQKIIISPPQGVTRVSPIHIYNNSKGGKSIRPRRIGDELADCALQRGQRPSRQALRIANALRVEKLLETGKYGNISSLAKHLKMCRSTLSDLLNMLNRSNAEIEKILFELN